MGAWNTGPFDNDDASDWLYELEESLDSSAITVALDAVAHIGDEYLEAPECSNALAAAEIVAALQDQPMEGLPDNARRWIDEHQGLDASSLVPVSIAVIERIGSNSELQELWEESEFFEQWKKSLQNLSGRLTFAENSGNHPQ